MHSRVGRALVALLLLAGASIAGAQRSALPQVKVFATGGTISGFAPDRDMQYGYKSGSVPAKDLLAGLPEASAIASITTEDVAATGSGGINTEILIRLAREINAWLAQPDTAGAVVTHGTGTLEETAFFLDLVVHSDKPVVVTGSMRPFTSISRDGPFNLYNAIRVAASPKARGMGVLVVMNEEIHAARDVTKTNTLRVNTMESRDLGPLGFADEDRIVFYRRPLYRHTSSSAFSVDTRDTLPRVDICYAYQDGDRACVDAEVASGARGVIIDDYAPGLKEATQKAQGNGVVFVQAERKGSGRTPREARFLQQGIVTADNLNAQKARILLRFALTVTSDPAAIQRIFEEY